MSFLLSSLPKFTMSTAETLKTMAEILSNAVGIMLIISASKLKW